MQLFNRLYGSGFRKGAISIGQIVCIVGGVGVLIVGLLSLRQLRLSGSQGFFCLLMILMVSLQVAMVGFLMEAAAGIKKLCDIAEK